MFWMLYFSSFFFLLLSASSSLIYFLCPVNLVPWRCLHCLFLWLKWYIIWCHIFAGSGVTTDLQTSYAARIMAISVLPFIIVQLPRVFKFPSGQRLAVLVALITSVALVLSYCLYQVFHLAQNIWYIFNNVFSLAINVYFRTWLWLVHFTGMAYAVACG